MFDYKPETKEFAKILKEFSSATYEDKGTHSYAAGYYESLLTSMFDCLTKKQREIVLSDMVKAVDRLAV